LYQSGRFTPEDTRFTWGILAAASVGLLATTLSRLYSSAFFALHDTRTPMRVSILRVVLASLLGAAFALSIPDLLGVDRRWGTTALVAASSIVAWIEFVVLRRKLNRRVGRTGLSGKLAFTLLFAALASGSAAYGIKTAIVGMHRWIVAGLVLGAFGVLYFMLTLLFGASKSVGLPRRLGG
jgi:putative peptidoglycan lipid II flippase